MPDITIDKSSLVYDDNEFEYKTRVPGTFGEDIRYLWIKKDDVDEINEGKTILTSLDDESKYMLYDKDDNLAETVRGSELYINHYDPVKEKENTESKNFDTINEKKSKSVGVKEENLQSVPTEPIVTETSKDTEFSIPIFATLYDKCNRKIDELNSKNDKFNAKIEKLKLQKQINKLTTKKEKLMRKLKALDEWSAKFDAVKAMPDKEADNIINKSCQNIVDEFTTNPQALKKQADTIVSSTAKVIFEENYLKNAEMSIEDDYDSIDGIINNGNKQQEYEKLKEPEKKSERRTAPLSRNQIKQNASKNCHNEQQTNDKTKTQGQEL